MTKTRRHIININISFTYKNNIKNKNIPNITTVTIARWRYNYRRWETTKVLEKMMMIWWGPRWWWWYEGDDGDDDDITVMMVTTWATEGRNSWTAATSLEESRESRSREWKRSTCQSLLISWGCWHGLYIDFFRSICNHVEKNGFLPSTKNRYDP